MRTKRAETTDFGNSIPVEWVLHTRYTRVQHWRRRRILSVTRETRENERGNGVRRPTMMTVVMLFIGPVLGMSADKNRAREAYMRVPRSSDCARLTDGSHFITYLHVSEHATRIYEGFKVYTHKCRSGSVFQADVFRCRLVGRVARANNEPPKKSNTRTSGDGRKYTYIHNIYIYIYAYLRYVLVYLCVCVCI